MHHQADHVQDHARGAHPEAPPPADSIGGPLDRRGFIRGAAAIGGIVGLNALLPSGSAAAEPEPKPKPKPESEPEPLAPVGEAKGIHPGRVAWAHDPKVTDWKGPGDGRWYADNRTKQDRVDAMMARAVCALTGEGTVAKAWDKLFRHLNQQRGKGDAAYKPGEKIVIKPNWVGMIWHEGNVDAKTYTLKGRQDYMNTAPQMLIALVRQLTGAAGVKQADVSVCDSLAYLVHEYHGPLHKEFPDVQYVDYAGEFGRVKVKPSPVPLFWSCRPQDKAPDFLPSCFAEAQYLVNFANLKAHSGAGVTLCGKNHFGSLVRWPAQKGYYDMHRSSFLKQTKSYREQVDLMGHVHLGGKTVLYLIDGLFSGIHPTDRVPRKSSAPPFDGNWASSLLASQDPVAIDSVGLDFLRAEYEPPRTSSADDYLREAALAHNPPSGTFYDPDHATPVKRLASLGVHEHWNNPQKKQYSRNLGTGPGIELVAVS